VFHAAVDDAADAFLELLDGLYESIDDLEGEIEQLTGPDVRRRLTFLRNELLRARRASSATRAIARRIVDGRVDVGESELFPREIEVRFVDTYETLVRATEELDVARDLLGGVRDYYQAKIAEQQNEVAKTLTVIAALVLVPSFIVGFYGQNFAGHFRDWYWSIGVSLGLIVATTVVQLVLFRRRRWI
jgi:magnesium transporter